MWITQVQAMCMEHVSIINKGVYMKRIFLYFLIMILFSAGAGWCVCEKGTIEFGANGKCYCLSSHGWNFLHALAWCDAQASDGLSRSTVHSVCDYDATNRWQEGSSECPNMRRRSDVKNASGAIIPSGGKRAITSLTSDNQWYAVQLQGRENDLSEVKNQGYDQLMHVYCNVPQAVCDEIRSTWE